VTRRAEPLPGRWAVALREWAGVLEQRGRTPQTAHRMLKQVRRFAAETGGASPWDTTPAQVAGWLEQLDVAPAVLYGYRTSLRGFFAWAASAGRMDSDPTLWVGGRLVKNEPPAAWRQPLQQFRRYLRSAGRPDTTITTRTDQLVHAARTLGIASPWDVTPDDLIDWLGTRGWARETVRARRSALRSFYAWAVAVGHVQASPAVALPVVRPRPPMPRPAPEGAVLDALHSAGPRERLMVRLAAEAGLRRAEVAAVNVRDLERDASGWWLWVRGKGERVRRLPLGDDLAGELRQRGGGVRGGWVFPGGDHGHLSPRWVGKILAGLLPAGVTGHALRHRFATQCYAVDHDTLSVQQLLGHASPATTQRYVALPADGLRRLVSAVAVDDGRGVAAC